LANNEATWFSSTTFLMILAFVVTVCVASVRNLGFEGSKISSSRKVGSDLRRAWKYGC
jgi:hypothetical protein